MLAYDYPLLGFFWSMMMLFFWIIWIMLLLRVFADIFRSSDMGGAVKALWIIFVIFLPFLGVFVYLISRGPKMNEHAMDDARARQEAFTAMVQDAGGSSTAAELEKLAALKDKGILTEAEFAAQKAALLG